MEPALTVSDLATVAGAGVAALIVTQFTKMLVASLSYAATRAVALLTGLTVVVVTTVVTGPQTFGTIALSVFVGMQAGMSAWGIYDAGKAGLNKIKA